MIVSNESINTGRQVEVDLLKAFTVVFSMIIVHVYDFDVIDFKDGFTWWIDIIFGGIFAAPMFMFSMGIGLEYTRGSDAGQMAVRGLKLLTVGQTLNLFRYALIFGVQALLLINTEYDMMPAMALNLSSDIMQFAGLSFLLMALFRKLRLRNWQIFIVAALMSVGGTMLERVETGCYGVDQVLGCIWGTETESFFPLLNWFVFVAAGKCFGAFYKRVANKTAFFLCVAPVGIISFAAVWYFQQYTSSCIFNSFDPDYFGFCWMRLPDSIAIIMMTPTVIGLFYLLARLLPKTTIDVLSHPSKHINQYYCVSWWWIMVLHLYLWANSIPALLSVWFNILTLTIVTVAVYNNHFRTEIEACCSRYRRTLVTLVWVITVGLAMYSFITYSQLPNQFNDYLM